MTAALEAGYELGALALCLVAIALLLAVKGLAEALHSALNVGFLGVHPFAHIATALENTLISWLDSALKGVERVMAKFESGLIDSFGMALAIPVLLALGVKAALTYLWNTALPALLSTTVAPIRTLANKALGQIDTLQDTVAANVGKVERYAVGQAEDALDSARSYTEKRVSSAASALRVEIAAGVAEAESFASTAVGKLRAAEDGAIANAVELAGQAKAAGLAAAAQALEAAELVTGVKVSQAEAIAAGALAEAQAAGKLALDAVRSVAVAAEDDLATIEGGLGVIGVAGLIASIPMIASLVHTIAAESGLENAECRGKVKGICGTDPSAWESLLSGLAALGFLVSLPELVKLANGVADELVPIIKQAG